MEKKTITREVLYGMVWSEPLTKLSKRYNISDNGIRKKCKKHNIPLPPIGYWSKLKYGKQPKRTPLPIMDTTNEIYLVPMSDDENYADPRMTFTVKLKRRIEEIKNDKNVNLKVPDRLKNADPLVKVIADYLNMPQNKKNQVSWQYLHDNLLDISVSEKKQNRALRLMDTFIKAIKARGHEIRPGYRRTRVIMYTVDRAISLREKHVSVKSDDKYSSRSLISTGKLAFKADTYYSKEWSDNSIPLEEKLASIIAWFEIKALELKAIWDQNEKRQQEEAEKQRLLKEIEERKAKERQKFHNLLDEAERWHKAKILRSYIDHVSRNQIVKDEQWFAWALEKADWYDPILKKRDNILGEYEIK